MHTERMKQILRVLRNVDPKHFDLQYWTNECGTTACACGHAAEDPWFIKEGFELHFDYEEPVYQGVYGYGAASKFFEIPPNVAQHLFSPFAYQNKGDPMLVHDRILAVYPELKGE